MIDYSEMKMIIQKLNEQVYSYLNAHNVGAAQEVAEKLEMSASMLKKYIDWISTNK
jgi:response regulator of citrate/malate metabolism